VKSAGLTEDSGTNGSYGTDLIDALLNAAITASSELAGGEAYRVKTSQSGAWQLPNDNDWGTLVQGYWQIPDAQAGLVNSALKPWIQFDLGSNKAVKIWRLLPRNDFGLDIVPRIVLFFSSTDASNWKHETYYEVPPRPGVKSDCLIHNPQSARYWRMCVRSRWSPSLGIQMMNKVEAHEGGRNYWQAGQIKFKADTTTVALRGKVATVLQSYSGEVVTTPLPVAPANGDTFIIERGCPRTFNGCCERLNWENYGGFDSMPFETVVR
jgi:hypothetical protein